jgi:hypothetical protein
MVQPEEVVEVVAPDLVQVSLPTDARALMYAARAPVCATALCKRDGAHSFQATAQLLGDELPTADATGAARSITSTPTANRMYER